MSVLGKDSHLEVDGIEDVRMVLDDAFSGCVYWMSKHGPYVVVRADNDFGVYSVATMGVYCIS